jgi:RNA recognition motif-containing protein
MNIYIGNLNFNLSEDELKQAFEEYGEVNSVKIISDKYSGRSKGFGFIEMPDDENAKKAIEELNGAEVKGRSLKVNQARERRDDNR